MANLSFPTETINSVVVTRAPARATAYYLVLFNKTTKAVESSHFFKCGVSTSNGAIGGDAWTDIQAQATTLGLTGLPASAPTQ